MANILRVAAVNAQNIRRPDALDRQDLSSAG